MRHQIIITQPYQEDTSDVITIQQYQKKRISRRKRVSRRMHKRFPLFAVEFMKDEFPDMNYATWEQDVITKRKSRAKKKGKSQLARQGRYPQYKKTLLDYGFSKDIKDLQRAQEIRNRMFKDFMFIFTLKGERRRFRLPSTASLNLFNKIRNIKGYKTWEEFDKMWFELIKYEKF